MTGWRRYDGGNCCEILSKASLSCFKIQLFLCPPASRAAD